MQMYLVMTDNYLAHQMKLPIIRVNAEVTGSFHRSVTKHATSIVQKYPLTAKTQTCVYALYKTKSNFMVYLQRNILEVDTVGSFFVPSWHIHII